LRLLALLSKRDILAAMFAKYFPLAIGILLVGLIFYSVVEALSFSDILDLLLSIHTPTAIVFLICSLSMALLRAWRYQVLLSSSGYKPSLFLLLLVTFVRNLFADLLPAKMGTLVYVGLITTRLKIPLPVALASWGYEYVLDVIALFPVILLATLFVSNAVIPVAPWMVISLGLVVLLTATLIALFLPFILNCAQRVILRGTFIRRQTFREKIDATRNALIEMRRGQILLPVIFLSVAIRFLKYASLYFLLVALLHPLGYQISEIPAAKVFFSFMTAEFAAALPLPSVLGFGAYQGAWSYVFELLGFPESIAKLTSIAHHVATQTYAYGLGIVAFLLLLKCGKSATIGKQLIVPMQFVPFASRFAMFLLLVFFAVSSSFSIAHPKSADSLLQPTKVPQQESLDNFLGKVIFDSQRSGSFGIYGLGLDSKKRTVLVDTYAHEMHPAVSPDGVTLLYTRAESSHRLAPSDIWAFSAGGFPSLLIRDGAYPTFSSDGSLIYFQRGRRAVHVLDRLTSIERQIFPKQDDEFSSRIITIPRVSPNGEWVAFSSDYPFQWHSWAVNLSSGERVMIGRGCQPFWDHSGDSLLFVQEHDAKGGSGLYRFNLKSRTTEVVIDADGVFGKEYFPFISLRGVLLWGTTTAERHSHIDGGYQIFLQRNNQVVQLTDDEATSRWPILIEPR